MRQPRLLKIPNGRLNRCCTGLELRLERKKGTAKSYYKSSINQGMYQILYF